MLHYITLRIYTYIYTYRHIHIYTYICICIYIYVCVCIYTYMCICIYTYIYIYIRIYTYIYIYVCMFVCIYAGERREAAKFVWGERVKVWYINVQLHCITVTCIMIFSIYAELKKINYNSPKGSHKNININKKLKISRVLLNRLT